ncbi:hypothetical protein jhhlp_003792 [Lomentospora prolificans]|uniref:A to I editase domain-containing protein n=1 Tax=Lomentospora prolificans TaxID=41688 RepID=A0A2N3N9R1_9PEZI|nr:hypothetical protein jhhlp_003792 [Lomentospora prolificans]
MLSERWPLIIAGAAAFLGMTVLHYLCEWRVLTSIPHLGSEIGDVKKRRMAYIWGAPRLYGKGYKKRQLRHRRVSQVSQRAPETPLPDNVGSLQAALLEIVKAKHTNLSFENGMEIARIIKADLNPALVRLNPIIAEEVNEAFRRELQIGDDWTEFNCHGKVLGNISMISGKVVVGPELCHNEECLDAFIKYTTEVMTAPEDMLQWLMEAHLKPGKVDGIVCIEKLQFGLSFAAIHTGSLFTTKHALAESGGNFTSQALQKMKKLDNFLRETARVTPQGFTSFHRKLLKTITLSSGQVLPAGSKIEIPTISPNFDNDVFANSEKFDAFQYSRAREVALHEKGARAAGATAATQFISVSPTNLVFGYGRHACPGRFFAVNEIKIIVANVLLKSDVKNADPDAGRLPNVEFASMYTSDGTKSLLFRNIQLCPSSEGPAPTTAPSHADPRSVPKADQIASLVLQQFFSLPKKRKPAIRDTGVHEWTPLSSIVAERAGELRCLSIATGMKCLPAAKLKEASGNGLHDWHAEILAIRAFNHYLLSEAVKLSQSTGENGESFILQWATPADREAVSQPFTIRNDVKLYMYSSEAPCKNLYLPQSSSATSRTSLILIVSPPVQGGDASMELTMSAQEDPTPWVVPTSSDQGGAVPSASPSQLPGRQYFSNLGIVRRKPSRPDAPPTLSKSCSDKLALAQATSLLSSLASLLINPANAYLSALILPQPAYVPGAFQRCFSDRMGKVRNATWEGGYRFRPLNPLTTSVEFNFSKREVTARSGGKIAPCNVSAVWGTHSLEEGLVSGVIQGRKAFQERAASALSRRRLWELAVDAAGLLGEEGENIREALRGESYGSVKENGLLKARRRVKEAVWEEALKGWAKNAGDEGFTLGNNT